MLNMAKAKKLIISDDDKRTLEEIIRTRTVPSYMMDRARILLLKAEGKSVDEIAGIILKNRNTVLLCLCKFKEGGINAALNDAPGRGRKAQITDEEKAWINNIGCQKPTEFGYSAEVWSYSKITKHIHAIAEASGYPRLTTISQSTVVKILDKAGIKPFKIKYYCEKRDPDFEEKMHNVLAVYKQVSMRFDQNGEILPYDENEPELHTVSYDEKPGIQAIDTTSPDLLPTLDNGVIMRDYEYKRLGTLSLLAGIDLLTGKAFPLVRESHKSSDFILFLKMLNSQYPEKDKIRIILDNHSAHKSKETKAFLSTMSGKFEFVFTPKHGSWLNLIEGFFGKMTHQMLRSIRVKSKQELSERIYKYFDEINEQPIVHHWTYRLDEINANEEVKIDICI